MQNRAKNVVQIRFFDRFYFLIKKLLFYFCWIFDLQILKSRRIHESIGFLTSFRDFFMSAGSKFQAELFQPMREFLHLNTIQIKKIFPVRINVKMKTREMRILLFSSSGIAACFNTNINTLSFSKSFRQSNLLNFSSFVPT